MTSPVMSSEAHWGKTETTHDASEILEYLMDPNHFTDDEVFQDEAGNSYSIDDLLGMKVTVGEITLEVHE